MTIEKGGREALAGACGFLQTIAVDNLDPFAIKCQHSLGNKCRKGTYGIAYCHVGKGGQFLSTKVDTQGSSIVLKSEIFFQYQQRFGQSATNMFLRERYGRFSA